MINRLKKDPSALSEGNRALFPPWYCVSSCKSLTLGGLHWGGGGLGRFHGTLPGRLQAVVATSMGRCWAKLAMAGRRGRAMWLQRAWRRWCFAGSTAGPSRRRAWRRLAVGLMDPMPNFGWWLFFIKFGRNSTFWWNVVKFTKNPDDMLSNLLKNRMKYYQIIQMHLVL
jgi:hypothetical protein